jgi:hypothetical protein
MAFRREYGFRSSFPAGGGRIPGTTVSVTRRDVMK